MVGNCYDCAFFDKNHWWCSHAMHKVDPKLAHTISYCPSFELHEKNVSRDDKNG